MKRSAGLPYTPVVPLILEVLCNVAGKMNVVGILYMRSV